MKQPRLLTLPGFLLSGFLFSLPGALLPAWGYHLEPNQWEGSLYFFCLSGGVVLAGQGLRLWASNWRVGPLLVAACSTGCAGFALLALGSSGSLAWRLSGWLITGLAAGLLNTGLFEAMGPRYRSDRASAVISAGIYFGLGCLASSLLIAGTFYLYSVPEVLLAMALIPFLFGVLYAGRSIRIPAPAPEPPFRQVFRDFLSPAAVLFAALLFFQSGSEWTIAGWLPVFLVRRMGISPESSVWLLSLYWFALLIGRLITSILLPNVRHSRLLLISATAALSGCLLLVFTPVLLGAITGILLVGFGFAAIYPLVAVKIGSRFPYYHPGVFNSIFSFALAGGMLAPGVAGLLADRMGLWVVMGIPALGTFLVVMLLLLIWLESRVTGQ